jgi:phosphoribosyl 1,2-cyclic phosphodiesterase
MPSFKFYGTSGLLPKPLSQIEINQILLSFWDHCKGQQVDQFNDALESFNSGKIISGNSACVEIGFDNAPVIICDAGSGIRQFGKELLKRVIRKKELYIFMSHTNWNHLVGFPFLDILDDAEYKINIMGCHDKLESRFKNKLNEGHANINISERKAKINFIELNPGNSYSLNNVKVTPLKLDHFDNSYAYKFSNGQKSILYSTDSNYQFFANQNGDSDLLSNIDVLIYDAMYNFKDYISSVNKGHSSAFIGIDFAMKHKIKQLFLFNHNPNYLHNDLLKLLEDAQNYKDKHYEGKELVIRLAREEESIVY